MIAIFVDPGVIPAQKSGAKDRSNRSFEYDTLSDQYARFLGNGDITARRQEV
jgi:hypothetical protein